MILLSLFSLTVSFKGGEVRYHTVLKALGMVPDPITGTSKRLSVRTSFSADSTFYLRIRVPVRSFKSGNTTRDRDVAKILGYPKYRYITFTLVSYPKGAIGKVLSSDSGSFYVKAKLRVKGRSRTYRWKVSFKWISDREVEFRTSRHVKFTDFGIKPPTLFGFVKRAPDDVEVSGRVVLEVRR